jgi:hypothetical protein
MNLRASLLVSADRSRRDPARTSPSCFIALVFNRYSLLLPSGMRSSMMNYAFNNRDLRVKKDVSDLELDPLFWRCVLGRNYFFASYRTDPSAAVQPVSDWT